MKQSYNKRKGETCSRIEFIEKAKKIHGDVYNYSLCEYINSSSKIKIICNTHGEFQMTPNNHLSGKRCARCAWEVLRKERQTEQKTFIRKAELKHKSIYDYSKVEYINCDKKIEIICPFHGSFFQSPYIHLNLGCGCPKCKKRISKDENSFLSYCGIPDTPINRQVLIGKKIVDGYEPSTNTIYEFLGDYWHGNPETKNIQKINPTLKKTYQNLYKKTMDKFFYLSKLGFRICYIWENDWKKFKKGIDVKPKIQII